MPVSVIVQGPIVMFNKLWNSALGVQGHLIAANGSSANHLRPDS